MEVATYLLFALGLMGAADIAMYHSVAHGIRSHPDSRGELIVHSLRGPTYAALFILIPNVALDGRAFWILVLLFVVDVVISIVDFALERRSREFFGGLPSGEYVLHILIAMVFGAMVTAAMFHAGRWWAEPARIAFEPAAVPTLLRGVMAVMALIVLWSGIKDLAAAIRLRNQPIRAAPSTPDTHEKSAAPGQ